jgi:ubiquinone/menaquinone biosynthesis C-methylase UbiE
MSAQPIGLRNRLVSLWDIFRSYQKGVFENAEADIENHKALRDTLRTWVGTSVDKARILDIGCGPMAKEVALFKTDGANVTGIDIEVPSYNMNAIVVLRSLTHNGFERAIKSIIRSMLFDGIYVKRLSACYGKTILYTKLDTRLMSATNLQFPDNQFDFIISNCVFEHIEDVPKAVQELNRVLKISGLARISIHLFPSPSGGHNLEWLFPDSAPSKRVPPWDHLLDNKYPANNYLNKLRLDDYRNIFQRHMVIVKEQTKQEGLSILTSDLRERLLNKGYLEKDLLTKYVSLYCRKRISVDFRRS